MPHDDLTQLVSQLRCVSQTEDLWAVALSFYHAHGIERVSYHVFGEGQGADEARQTVRTDGYPKDWVSDYLERAYFVIDPIPELARQRMQPFLWSEVENIHSLSPGAVRFLEDFRSRDLGDGLAMQVFGPNLRNAYVGLGFGQSTPNLNETRIALLQVASQALHQRYCELTETAEAARVELSPRELEVLKLIARGKSNSVISDIMGVSRHTVDTLVRRLFGKLGATDRTTAAIKGIGEGFLHRGELPE